MTWSIVARDPQTGHLGVAVASRFFAVGAAVPHIRGRVGAIATQAFVSPLYGTDGLALLAEGRSPEEIISLLTTRDDGCQQRQLHLIDRAGRNAAFTGSKCVEWAGHIVNENVSVAGNMLAGPQVIAETLASTTRWPMRLLPSACWWPWTPARRPAVTSAASSRLRS